jgi:hypothetical protein
VLEGQERALAGRDLLPEKSQQRLAKEETVSTLTTVKTLTPNARVQANRRVGFGERNIKHRLVIVATRQWRRCVCHTKSLSTKRKTHNKKTGPKSSPV